MRSLDERNVNEFVDGSDNDECGDACGRTGFYLHLLGFSYVGG